MAKYLRTGPIVTKAAGYLQTDQQPFDWVDDIKDAAKDYLESVEVTRQQLADQHQIETEAMEVPRPGRPQSAGSTWAIKKKE